MATRKIKDAKDLSTQELIYFKGHAKATFMSDGATVEDAVRAVENATYKNKGYFPTLAELQSAFPKGSAGSRAYVGSTYPYSIYLWQNGAWVDSGATGGDESVDLASYYTKSETDTKLTELSAEIAPFKGIYQDIPFNADTAISGAVALDGSIYSFGFRTAPVSVQKGSLITCTGFSGGPAYVFCSEWKNGVFVRSLFIPSDWETPNFTIEADADMDVVFSGGSYETASIVITKNKVYDTILQQGEEIEKLAPLPQMVGEYIDDTDYLRVYLDGKGRFLFGIKQDGSIEWVKGVPQPVKDYVESCIASSQPELLNILSLQPAEEYQMNYEAVVDAENKLLSWLDKSGVRHETKLKVENNLELSKSAMSKFIQSLIASGFTTDNPIDHSSESSIALPIPRYCAVVNIISPLGLATSKTQDIQCELEYLDKSGNYFKKPIILNAQGTSSMAYIEKNQSIDVFNDESREESCEIKFDNWVAQDSFHLKCYYIDVFRGISNIGYKWTEEVIKATRSRNNRVKWNREDISEYNSTGDFAADFSDSALCHPDGFPFEMYLNGEYYGLYAWNLKKHRKNYSMKKGNYKELLLDGKIDNSTFFNGSIDWAEIELRNPKTLITMTGAEYDGENPTELIDNSSSAYNSANKDHTNTAITKSAMQRIANALPQIREASTEQAKVLFENYFDKKALMRYFIISNVLYHHDGFAKNWIWTIYDGIAAPTEYDMDSIFGRDWTGLVVLSDSTSKILGTSTDTITGQLIRLYKDELDAMYQDLRDANILSVENIMRYVHSWCEDATYDALERNIEKWTSIPSYRKSKNQDDGTMEGGMFDSPHRIEKWLSARIATLDNYFNRG